MRYKHDPGSNRSLIDNSVYSIYEDRSGIIWIGTYGSGLSRFDRYSVEGLFVIGAVLAVSWG